MNKYFTKKYIKECDCKEIQGLKDYLNVNDFYYDSIACTWEIYCPHKEGLIKTRGGVYIWLPTGDQLDEEIVKICKEKKYIKYDLCYKTTICICSVIKSYVCKYDNYYIYSKNSNPLIAKIKLLKKLLKE